MTRSHPLAQARHQGFTLIEIMIVVAIIAILAAIAVPVYQNYVIRSQVSEAISLAEGAKVGLAEYRDSMSTWPANNTAAGLAPANNITGHYVSAVGVSKVAGQIEITFGNSAHPRILSQTLVLSAITSTGSTDWRCKGGTLPAQYLPSSCRS
ncbi:prepilin-type N-terminal cleavage/methylation domain-containing protein [Luteimonas terrae]|uniref:Prepilin-type N-terminal cleavage/methylation domain-containing protein n=2 Tax=Luteimonas terrae TaxID=1530191 RepID=A0A4R5U704_9GAMM|nr:prepilin-type N-terminal cleavage/methylation domain-containing protein [Luteimonas terrae]